MLKQNNNTHYKPQTIQNLHTGTAYQIAIVSIILNVDTDCKGSSPSLFQVEASQSKF